MSMKSDVQFTPQDWERIKRDWSAWWEHDLDRPMVVVEDFDWQGKSFIPQFDGWDLEKDMYPTDSVLDYYQSILETASFYGDSWPRWWPNFGAGIVAGFQGAKIGVDENTVWFEAPETFGFGDLQIQFDAKNYWWRWVKAITLAAVNRWGDQITVATTDLGGNADILASLRGTQNLLMDLYDIPEVVDDLIAQTTQLWLHYYDELHRIIRAAGIGTTAWAPLWSPGRYYMLQSDFAYMISPSMFERFVLPDLEAICHQLDHGFYHLDGKGQIPHLDMLLGMERLCGIQWIPGDGAPPPEKWLPLLKRIRQAGKLCQLYVSAEGALTIARELGGKGFTFVISPAPKQGIEEVVKALYRL
jgi:5-methyltetrahydrofolate--homocysteine methyltransferase